VQTPARTERAASPPTPLRALRAATSKGEVGVGALTAAPPPLAGGGWGEGRWRVFQPSHQGLRCQLSTMSLED
jgi:hypothetical protein